MLRSNVGQKKSAGFVEKGGYESADLRGQATIV